MGIPLTGPIRSAFSSSVASGRPSSRSMKSIGLFSPRPAYKLNVPRLAAHVLLQTLKGGKMNCHLPAATTLALFLISGASGQKPPTGRENVPIYSVTVIERTVKAVNYQYRSAPTPVDFRGTIL